MDKISTSTKARVLVVDDTPDNLFLMSALLEDRYEVLTASSGPEALAVAQSSAPPELILLDIVMPGMNGHDVLRRLRADQKTAGIPVIFLTALVSVEEEQLGIDLGAVDYIAKPISPPIVLARVQSHLERSTSSRRLRALSEKLGRYLAPQVYKSLFDGSRDAEIRTQRKKLTVFFSDIKDFTSLTAQWAPEEITFVLNNYFSEMSRIANDHGGTIDKFVGDQMMVFFGDPESRGPKEDASQCVKMAMAMQRRMGELREIWREMGVDKSFRVRMGINSGYCNVGNFGSDLRMDYTIIGPEVNLASRLEHAADPGAILMSRSTWLLVRDEIVADERAPIKLKGITEPLVTYAVRGTKASSEAARKAFQWDKLGMRVLVDLDRLPPSERAAAFAAAATQPMPLH